MKLEARDISVRFGGIQALKDVSLTVEPGQIAAVVGSNGSGKSTLFNAIMGFAPLESGEVVLNGRRISELPAWRRVQLGLCRTFQTPRLDPEATALEAVKAGGVVSVGSKLWDACFATPQGRRDGRDLEERAYEVLDELGLGDLADSPMGELPMGTVRLIDVGRAVMGNPSFILLDEPAAGLSHAEQDALKSQIRRLAADGVGVLLVEHNFRFVLDLADQMTVLENGHVLDHGDPDRVSTGPEFIRIYLGSAGATGGPTAKTRAAANEEPLMRCRSVTARHGRIQVVHGIDLDVPRAGVVALMGANGAGKSSLLGAIGGLVRSEGTIQLDGEELHQLPAHRRAERGICFVPEIRGNIFPTLSVRENLELSQRRLSSEDLRALRHELTEMFPRIHERFDSEARMLSGGEQQMLALAMAISQRPRVLLLDEPTQGLAPAVYDVLVETVQKIVDHGIGVVLAEQNAAFAARLADRVVVLADGEVSLSAGPELLFDRERLMRAYMGPEEEGLPA